MSITSIYPVLWSAMYVHMYHQRYKLSSSINESKSSWINSLVKRITKDTQYFIKATVVILGRDIFFLQNKLIIPIQNLTTVS